MSKLSPREIVMLEGLKKVILRKVQQGKGVRAGDIINAVINFIEKLGVPVTKTTWNKFIIPTIDVLFLRKLSSGKRKAIKKFLRVGGRGPVGCRIVNGHVICPSAGLRLAGQGKGGALKLPGQGKGGALRLAGQGRSLGAKRKTKARQQRLGVQPVQFQDLSGVRMGLKGLGKKNPKRVAAGKKAAKKNRWAIHLKKTFAANRGIAFKAGVKLASATFKKK